MSLTDYTSNAPERCSYCGKRLDPDFYFCTHCATPYKSADSVVPAVRPRKLTEGMLIRSKAPHVGALFWTYLGVVLGSAIFGYLVFGEDRFDLQIVFSSLALFVTTAVFAALHWPSLRVQLERPGLFQVEAVIGVAALAPLLACNYLYSRFLVEIAGANYAPLVEKLREAGLSQMAIVFLICAIPAVLEEIAFRGLAQHWLQTAVSPLRALFLASALFAAMHFSILSAPYIFALGLLLGWLKWRTGSLYPSMLVHFLHNFAVVEWFRF